MMNERISKVIAGSTLVAIVAYGLAGCSSETNTEPKAPTKLSACPQWWGSESNRIGFGETQSEAHAALQRATSELIAKVKTEAQSGDSPQEIQAKYGDAATRLFKKTGERKLDQPAEEFCIDDAYLEYKTPAYITAEQALEVAGITVDDLEY